MPYLQWLFDSIRSAVDQWDPLMKALAGIFTSIATIATAIGSVYGVYRMLRRRGDAEKKPAPVPTTRAPDGPAGSPEERFSKADLDRAAGAVAWECFRASYSPEPIPRDTAIRAVRAALPSMPREKAPSLVDQLVGGEIEVLRLLPDGSLTVNTQERELRRRAVSLAADFRVTTAARTPKFWDNVIDTGQQRLEEGKESKSEEERGRIVDFLRAMRVAGEALPPDLRIPGASSKALEDLESQKPFTEIKEYFANFVRRWGVPEGLGPLQESAALHRSCIRITKRNKQIVRLESINGSGELVPKRETVSYLASESSQTQGECRLQFRYDEYDNIILEEAYDAAGRLLYRCAYTPARPSREASPGQRETTAHYFIDASDIVSPRSRSGAAFVKITRNANGFDERWEFVDGLDRRQPDDQGRFGQRFENDDRGLPIRVICLGRDLKPAPCKSGYVRADYTYDAHGNQTSQRYFDGADQAAFHSEGYHEARFSWDARDNWTTVHLLGPKSESVLHADGFAGWDATYDQRGNQTGQTNRDQMGNPVIIKAGYAIWTGSHDKNGRLIDITYRDARGESAPDRYGIVGVRFKYNDLGDIEEVSYHDKAGNPATDFNGVARWSQKVDQRGRVTDTFWFGLDDKPVRNREGYAGFRASYDAKGNQVELIYLGSDGRPDWCNDGFAQVRTVYDERSNVTEERYFGPNREPIENNDGIHRKRHTYTYNELGKRVDTEFFDALGNRVEFEGYSLLRQSYDLATEKPARKEYRGPAGSLVVNHSGYAIEDLEYDSCGRQTQALYSDSIGRPVFCAEGYAGWTATYDSRGLCVQRRFLDTQGKPFPPSPNVKYVGWTASYDGRGNVIKRSYVDLAGEPALFDRGYGTVTYTYDDFSNCTEVVYFGLRGERIARDDGISKIKHRFDNRSNKIEEAYLGADDRPVTIKEGFSSWKATYDPRGNRAAQYFFGLDKDGMQVSVADEDGFSGVFTEYDDHNRPILERKVTGRADDPSELEKLFSTAGATISREYDPKTGRTEVYSNPRQQIKGRYNRAGRLARVSFFGTDGSPDMKQEEVIAYHSLELFYDSCGRPIQKRYVDTVNAPVRVLELGYDGVGKEVVRQLGGKEDRAWRVTTTRLYPDGGKEVEVALFSDHDRKTRVSDPDGRTRWVERYDARDNRLEADYFDASGAPTFYRGHFRTVAGYDDTNRLSKAVYLFPSGETDLVQRSFVFKDDLVPTVRFESCGSDGKSSLNQAVVLQYRMAQGDVCRYSALVNSEQAINGKAPERKEVGFLMQQHCTDVRADGTYEIKVVVEGQPPRSVDMIMARTGKMLKSSLDSPINQPPFPTHPVFMGEAWRQDMPLKLENPYTGQASTVTLTYTYLLMDVTEQEGRRVARIQVRCAPTVLAIAGDATQSISATGETLFAIDQGALLSTRVSTESTLAVGDEIIENNIEVLVSLEQKGRFANRKYA
jgi:hypothetical protein